MVENVNGAPIAEDAKSEFSVQAKLEALAVADEYHVLGEMCGFCYATAEDGCRLSRCARCRKRVYCSKECQTEDWKRGAHKHWCGIIGELGHDVAVRRVEGKGLGMVALRHFARDEKIMVERAAVTRSRLAEGVEKALQGVSAGMQRAAAALLPHTTTSMKTWSRETWTSKFQLNGFEMEDPPGEEGLFVLMASANHSCVPNAVHQSVASQNGLKILVASHDIEVGDEICHNYVGIENSAQLAKEGHAGVQRHLQEVWGFKCTCIACTDHAIGAKLNKMCQLDAAIVSCGASDVRVEGGAERHEEALRLGDELISLYGELGYSSNHYARTYYLLFQLAVTRSATLEKARRYIELARDNRRAFIGNGIKDEDLKTFERYVHSPESHNAYLAGDP
eukprot:2017874-Rhodomonas_salina.1